MVQVPPSKIQAIAQQRQFFNRGVTRDLSFRREQLQRLRQTLLAAKAEIQAAVKADLNKPEFESYAFEIGTLKEIDFALQHLNRWAKPQRVSLPLEQMPGTAYIQPEPLGVVLIIGPWNYPFNLLMAPLVGAIAAGNCAILKPSELAPHTSRLVARLIQETFDPDYVTVVEGGIETARALLEEKFDHIFFTGGTAVGKVVMAAAAQHLTPVTLELGGKSPCIVDSDIDLACTAKRIAWGKFFNAGQSCVAPDYLLVHRPIKTALLEALRTTVQQFYGDDPAQSPDYARIISDRHFTRLTQLLTSGNIYFGGSTRAEDLYIAPTLLDNVSPHDPIMQDEIFGPILPVLEYEELEEAIALINARPKPLALYIFSRQSALQERILQSTSSGGVCINDTMMQTGISALPFGGVGDSGIGSYHGKASFNTFSHFKSILRKPFWLELNWRFAPYRQWQMNLLKRVIG